MNNYLDPMAARSPVRDFTNRGEDFDRRVEAMEADIFAAKLAALPTLEPVYRHKPDGAKVCKLWDVLQEINGDGLEYLARAIRDRNEEEAGKEICVWCAKSCASRHGKKPTNNAANTIKWISNLT